MERNFQESRLACHANLCCQGYSEELVLALLPGTVCKVEKDYGKGKKESKRRWDFKDTDWNLDDFIWHTNRVLFIVEPEKYYSIEPFLES